MKKQFRNSSKKIFILCCLILCFLFFWECINRKEISDTTISYFYDKNGLITISLEDGKSFVIDTGADASLIFSDRLKVNSTIRGVFWVNKKRLLSFKKVDSLQIENLLIKNHNFVFEKAKNTVFEKDTTIVGIIGMDILSQKYCYFDVKNQTIIFSDEKKVQTDTPSFVFSYKSSKIPVSDMCINGIMFEDVLFDTGFNLFLKLFETDTGKLNNQPILRQDTNYDFSGNQLLTYHEQYDSVLINGVNFQNQEISYGQNYHLLGMKFVKCWSSFSIDPFKKEIEFYL